MVQILWVKRYKKSGSASNQCIKVLDPIINLYHIWYKQSPSIVSCIIYGTDFYGVILFCYSTEVNFKLVSPYKPAGDQPQAIKALFNGLERGERHQTLLGVTGSGKTFTVANVIAQFGKPTLVIAHNKTLAAQLTQEYRDFFPENAVH